MVGGRPWVAEAGDGRGVTAVGRGQWDSGIAGRKQKAEGRRQWTVDVGQWESRSRERREGFQNRIDTGSVE